jgi:5'-deoxynucleotidase YfbR-like HD superfamily hydrolase
MQALDKGDPRKPYEQIATSIRADILSGALRPGQMLPSVGELAEFFGVARMTVASALRVLREEGFISAARPGSRAHVRDAAQLPVPDDEEHPLAGAAAFIFEMGHLKQLPRAGWLMLPGMTGRVESVAEHSFRVSMIGIVLAALTGADPGHTAALCTFHDGHEARVGDIPSVGRAYVTTAAPEAVTHAQTAAMPGDVAKVFAELTAEYEANETLEAQLAHDADKLDTLAQAAEYAAAGHDTAAWRRSSIEALRTDAGKQLAQALGAGVPASWLAPFQRSYAELRANAKLRAGSAPEQ